MKMSAEHTWELCRATYIDRYDGESAVVLGNWTIHYHEVKLDKTWYAMAFTLERNGRKCTVYDDPRSSKNRDFKWLTPSCSL